MKIAVHSWGLVLYRNAFPLNGRLRGLAFSSMPAIGTVNLDPQIPVQNLLIVNSNLIGGMLPVELKVRCIDFKVSY